MYRIGISFLIVLMIPSSGCIVNPARQSATPVFVTSTLPATPIPKATQTINPSAEILSGEAKPTPAPSEGIITTQVNVRAGRSTADESMGMINPFTRIQVTGKDASGSWYRIVYAGSAKGIGWVRAEYVQLNAPIEIPLVESMTGSGSSGLVIQKINVRKGPAQTFESLGVLNPNDVVFMTGKDPSGKWIQIEFANAPAGTGWVALEFLQVGNTDYLPTIGESEPAEPAPTNAGSISTPILPQAFADGDSMQAPLTMVSFSPSGSRALQIQGAVSGSNGDVEDWIQFRAYRDQVSIQATCLSDTLHMELWNNGRLLEGFLFSCGEKSFVTITPNRDYFLRIWETSMDQSLYTSYVLNVGIVR